MPYSRAFDNLSCFGVFCTSDLYLSAPYAGNLSRLFGGDEIGAKPCTRPTAFSLRIWQSKRADSSSSSRAAVRTIFP
jgi:hypothetical protein